MKRSLAAHLLELAPLEEEPGLRALVRVAGEVILERGELRAPLPLYSLVKPMLATTLRRASAQASGTASSPEASPLLGPIPGLPLPPWVRELPLEDVLDHRSGLEDYGNLPLYRRALERTPREPPPAQEILGACIQEGPRWPSGEGFHYSNVGYALLARRPGPGGTPTRERLLQELLEPLGMGRTRWVEDLRGLSHLAPGGTRPGPNRGEGRREEPEDFRERYHPDWVLHGLLGGPLEEYARFLEACLPGESSLPGASRLIPSAPLVGEVPGPFQRPAYRWGFMVDRGPDLPCFGHNGDGPGASLSAFCYPDLGPAVILVAQDHDLRPRAWNWNRSLALRLQDLLAPATI